MFFNAFLLYFRLLVVIFNYFFYICISKTRFYNTTDTN